MNTCAGHYVVCCDSTGTIYTILVRLHRKIGQEFDNIPIWHECLQQQPMTVLKPNGSDGLERVFWLDKFKQARRTGGETHHHGLSDDPIEGQVPHMGHYGISGKQTYVATKRGVEAGLYLKEWFYRVQRTRGLFLLRCIEIRWNYLL